MDSGPIDTAAQQPPMPFQRVAGAAAVLVCSHAWRTARGRLRRTEAHDVYPAPPSRHRLAGWVITQGGILQTRFLPIQQHRLAPAADPRTQRRGPVVNLAATPHSRSAARDRPWSRSPAPAHRRPRHCYNHKTSKPTSALRASMSVSVNTQPHSCSHPRALVMASASGTT